MEKRRIPQTKVNRNYDKAGYEFKYKFKATDTGIMIISLTFKLENIIPIAMSPNFSLFSRFKNIITEITVGPGV